MPYVHSQPTSCQCMGTVLAEAVYRHALHSVMLHVNSLHTSTLQRFVECFQKLASACQHAASGMQDQADSSGFRQVLRPLVNLPSRSPQPQPLSPHQLFSRAEGHPPCTAATSPTRAGPQPPAGPAPSSREGDAGLGQPDSTGVSSECAATIHACEAGCGISGAAEHSSRDYPPGSSTTAGSNPTASETSTSHAVRDDSSNVGHQASGLHPDAAVMQSNAQEVLGNPVQPSIQTAPESRFRKKKRVCWGGLMKEPFTLLMHLFALALSAQNSAEPSRREPLSVPAAAAGNKIMLFQASLYHKPKTGVGMMVCACKVGTASASPPCSAMWQF